jgi:5-methylcytosine-specific restriction endonuclease McrA
MQTLTTAAHFPNSERRPTIRAPSPSWRRRAHRCHPSGRHVRRGHSVRTRTVPLPHPATRYIPAFEHTCDTGVMPAKFCLDCGELTRNGSRCEDCDTERTARRNARPKANTTQRGLGHAHRARAKAVLAAAQVCEMCGMPPTTADPLTADHTIPRSRGGGDSPLRAVHRSCNSRAGAQLQHDKRRT